MAKAGGARAIAQDKFTPIELAKQMQKLALDPGALANAAARARAVGRPDAARAMADLVERVGQHPDCDPQYVQTNVLRSMPDGVPA